MDGSSWGDEGDQDPLNDNIFSSAIFTHQLYSLINCIAGLGLPAGGARAAAGAERRGVGGGGAGGHGRGRGDGR